MAATAFASSPAMLALGLAAIGLFAAIYHPIGTAMLVDAAGDKPGRAIGVNGVFGNVGVALAPVVTAFLAHQAGWRAAFLLPGVACVRLGLLWLRVPSPEARGAPLGPAVPRHPAPSGAPRRGGAAADRRRLRAGVQRVHAAAAEADAGAAGRQTRACCRWSGAAAFLATLCGALTQFTVGRMIDRTTLKRVFLPVSVLLVPGAGGVCPTRRAGWCCRPPALVAAAIFGQVTVNETMTARYISPALRARMYSVRFFVGFLGAAASAPLVAWLYERTGSLATVTLVLAGFGVVTSGLCAGVSRPARGAAAGAVGGGCGRGGRGGGGVEARQSARKKTGSAPFGRIERSAFHSAAGRPPPAGGQFAMTVRRGAGDNDTQAWRQSGVAPAYACREMARASRQIFAHVLVSRAAMDRHTDEADVSVDGTGSAMNLLVRFARRH